MIKSQMVGRAILVSHPELQDQLLVVQVEIDCPDCGKQMIQIAGHHLKALRNLLVEFIDQHPTLTGDEAGIEVIKRINFTGRSTPTPEDN